jgi:hypothetical protein
MEIAKKSNVFQQIQTHDYGPIDFGIVDFFRFGFNINCQLLFM